MRLTRGTLAFLFLILCFATIGSASPPDQPNMQAARTNLLQARANLQNARHNKGGHRVTAIGYINSAIAEVNAGISFDRRNNHAVATSQDQPNMERALVNLRSARTNLEKATSDKGGHRVKAIGYINQAIDEVKKGIDAGN